MIGRRQRSYRLLSVRVRNEAYASLPYDLSKLWWTFGLQRKGSHMVVKKGSCPNSSESCLKYQPPCPSLFQYNHHMTQKIHSVCILLQSSHHSPLLSCRNWGTLLQASA